MFFFNLGFQILCSCRTKHRLDGCAGSRHIDSSQEEVFFKMLAQKQDSFKFKIGFHSPRNFQPGLLIEKIQLIAI